MEAKGIKKRREKKRERKTFKNFTDRDSKKIHASHNNTKITKQKINK